MPIVRFLRRWTLPISMIVGALSYFVYKSIPALDDTHATAMHVISIVQPTLLFCMLLLTFLRIKISDLRLRPWHAWGLMLQLGLFALCTVLILVMPDNHWRIVVEGTMLCLICPTATAAAVVTGKLGGNQATLTTYTILINLCVAIAIPAVVPLIHPSAEATFLSDAAIIMSKVFPLLICPLLLSVVMRHFLPRLTAALTRIKDLAFYLWAVSLALAIAVTTRSIANSQCPVIYEAGIALTSALACAIQFYFGRKIGRRYGETISAAQSLGQKNTVLAIWMGYTFFTPLTSIAGGFYSIWHNVYNSYQLYQNEKRTNTHANT